MKRHHFSLAGVLRVRRIEEDLARAGVAAAAADLDQARTHADGHLARYRGLARPGGAEHAATFAARQGRAALAAATVDGARAATAVAAGQLARRRASWQEASVRVAALERLAGRQADGHARAVRHDEELAVDELVTGRHGRERS